MKYLSIKEARELTGKSDSTIRRAMSKAKAQGTPDHKILNVLQDQIKDQRVIITHQQEQITKLQDQVQDKSEKLEHSFMLITDMEKKLLESKNEQLREQQKNSNQNTQVNKRFEFIWVAGLILVALIFLYIAFTTS